MGRISIKGFLSKNKKIKRIRSTAFVLHEVPDIIMQDLTENMNENISENQSFNQSFQENVSEEREIFHQNFNQIMETVSNEYLRDHSFE